MSHKTIILRLSPNLADETKLLDLCRKYSSCVRYAYNWLLEGDIYGDLRKSLQSKFELNARYAAEAVLEAQAKISSIEELGHIDPTKIVFGSKKLFEQLNNKGISDTQRSKLRDEWVEKRQCNLYNSGDTYKDGNQHIRFVDGHKLRITVGHREWIYLDYKGHHKLYWSDFQISVALGTPYAVRVQRRNNIWLAYVTFEIVKKKAVAKQQMLGIDFNASPHSIAITSVNEIGNIVNSENIKTGELTYLSTKRRELKRYELANQIVDLALQTKSSIAMDGVNVQNSKKGSGSSKRLRRVIGNFGVQSLRDKITSVAERKGVVIVETPCNYTSVIGVLKYAPRYGLSNHVAAAMVQARRAQGRIEEVPKNLRCLSSLQDESSTNGRKLDSRMNSKESFGKWQTLKKVTLTELGTGWRLLKRQPSPIQSLNRQIPMLSKNTLEEIPGIPRLTSFCKFIQPGRG
jgi:predicted transposase